MPRESSRTAMPRRASVLWQRTPDSTLEGGVGFVEIKDGRDPVVVSPRKCRPSVFNVDDRCGAKSIAFLGDSESLTCGVGVLLLDVDGPYGGGQRQIGACHVSGQL